MKITVIDNQMVKQQITAKNLKAPIAIFFYIIYATLFGLFSCSAHHHEAAETLNTLDSLIWKEPAQTLAILTNIPDSLLSTSESMHKKLLLEHAHYKCQLELSPESIMQPIVTYYQATGNKQRLGEALYVQGVELAWLGDNTRAMYMLKEAEPYLKNPKIQDEFRGMLYYKMGAIAEQEELYQTAYEYYQQALPYFQQSNNHRYLAYNYRDLGRTCEYEPKAQELQKNYFDKALHYAQNIDTLLYLDILLYATHYLAPTDTQTILNIHYYQCNTAHIYRNAYYIANNYLRQNQIDSCKHYLDVLACDTANLAWSRRKYHYLYSEYLYKTHKEAEAFKYLQNAYNRREHEMQEHTRMRATSLAKRYDLEKELTQNLKLQHQADQQLIAIVCIAFGIIVIGLAGTIITHKLRHRNNLQKQQIQHQREQLLLLLKNKIECTKLLHITKHSMGTTPPEIQEIIHKMTYTNDSREALYNDLQVLYPTFLQTIRQQYPLLTTLDCIIIFLIGAHFSTLDITHLLWMAPNTLHQRRNIIKQRLNLNDVKHINEWIQNYMQQYL